MKPLARLSVGALSVVLAIGLAGCNNSSPSADPDPAQSSASSPTESPSQSHTESPEPTVAPADGKLIDTDYFSMRAPKGFIYNEATDLTSSLYRVATDDAVFFSVLSGAPEMSLDELADFFLGAASYQIIPKRVDDTEIDGRPVWHATGPVDDYKVEDVYGLWINGAAVTVTFNTLPTGERRTKLIETMLASWTWK